MLAQKNLMERDHLEDLDVDLKNGFYCVWRCRMDSSKSEYGTVAVSYENGNKLS